MLAGYGPIDADTARELISAQLAEHVADDGAVMGPGVPRPRVRWRHTITSDDGELLHTRDHAQRRQATTAVMHPTRSPSVPTPRPPVEFDPGQRGPGPALSRWTSTRDRTCRAPGCRVPARVADIDHTIDHADGGPTSHENLAVACRHHHRLKHEGGWNVDQPTPGTLIWMSPRGDSYRRDPDPP
jgi:hypothetical protein